MTREKVLAILEQHVPFNAVEYCLRLWMDCPFHLKVTRGRVTKAGDFFCASSQAIPRITINNDLNPYLFLITYVHEVAHLHTFRSMGKTTDPHGTEWKRCFQEHMRPILTTAIFPAPLFEVLFDHMKNPKASSYSDATLTRTLRMYDQGVENRLAVSELPEGSLFLLRGKYFKKGKLRRTRYLCHEVKSRRQYLVPAEALVNAAQLSLGLSA